MQTVHAHDEGPRVRARAALDARVLGAGVAVDGADAEGGEGAEAEREGEEAGRGGEEGGRHCGGVDGDGVWVRDGTGVCDLLGVPGSSGNQEGCPDAHDAGPGEWSVVDVGGWL